MPAAFEGFWVSAASPFYGRRCFYAFAVSMPSAFEGFCGFAALWLRRLSGIICLLSR
jgi:hypothetical protein